MKSFITKNSKETHNLADKLAKNLRGGEILALIGDLGSGKTTFVQGLAKSLGIKEKITSPTFVWLKTYPLKKRFIKKLHHFDLYRLDLPKTLEVIGLNEYLSDPQAIIVIEWADKIKEILPGKTRYIKFKHAGKNRRIIIFS